MINYQILKDVWAILAVLSGLGVMFFTVLVYFDMWRPRAPGKQELQQSERPFRDMWAAVPWSLKISSFVLIVCGVAYGLYLIANPPNW